MTSLINTLACSVCMGVGEEHRDSIAAGYAMLVMLLIIVPMLCAIIFFIVRMARREQEQLDPALADSRTATDHQPFL
ncbi:hypothetical protein HW115_07665 [Verrucomicrobiaceae bacterium N1E253]|uniref:Uncharacterized protein n=1 Tax=Oceaniferula marina TaxID=2748318 RepID=A0A851GMZ1_9BACT|nr:hypothetical protein [Oceaniferula marina]NWK55484.1 hypothetical protein [Oceaniferula marina]